MGRRYEGRTRPVPAGELTPGMTVVDIPGGRLRVRAGRWPRVVDRRAAWDDGPVWHITLDDRPRRPFVLDLGETVTIVDAERGDRR